MKVTTVQEKCMSVRVEQAVQEFEHAFLKLEPGEHYYHLIAHREYSRLVCDEIEVLYTQAGWKRVKCRTSSENDERPGLTGLQLYAN